MLHWATRFFVYVHNFLSKRKCACDREWWQNTLQKSHMPRKKKKNATVEFNAQSACS